MTESELHSRFGRMFRLHWESFFLLACRKVGSSETAKDLVQEAFITLWDRRELLSDESKIPGFLYGVLRNKILQLFEKNEVRLRYVLETARTEPEEAASAHKQLIEKEVAEVIQQAMAGLPSRMKEIYVLKKEKGYSVRQIAGLLNLSEQTVKNQLHLALKRLRAQLSNYHRPLVKTLAIATLFFY